MKHVEHIVFEEDLPAWEDFQAARAKPIFRQRRRMELRLLARFSRTLRRYGCCERGPWSAGEAAVAEALLQVLRARGARELEAARLDLQTKARHEAALEARAAVAEGAVPEGCGSEGQSQESRYFVVHHLLREKY